MEGADKPENPEEKTIEQIEEEKLKAKYPNLVTKGPAILHKRLNRNIKYFDSGDYNMAKARCNISQQGNSPALNPTTSSNAPLVSAEIVAAQQTGDTIPTPENVPAVRKKVGDPQQEHPGNVNATTAAQTTSRMPVPGSPTKPTAESNLFSAPSH